MDDLGDNMYVSLFGYRIGRTRPHGVRGGVYKLWNRKRWSPHDNGKNLNMPYLEESNREKFQQFSFQNIETAGELNYVISQLICLFLADKVKNYAAYNAVIGALECCKLEVYRRLVAPYENQKCEENGDVFV